MKPLLYKQNSRLREVLFHNPNAKVHKLIPLFKNKSSSLAHIKTLILEAIQTLIPNLKAQKLKVLF
jgi:hypothetical protein